MCQPSAPVLVPAGVLVLAPIALALAHGVLCAPLRLARLGLAVRCRAAALVAGGGKGCFWGCLGLADCEAVCDLDAIYMDHHDLPVVIEDACTACGDCVDACPKDLFSLHPISHHLWVACKNLEKGQAALADCDVGCDACGKCAVDAPKGLIEMVSNLPVVDYERNHDARNAIERCPTGAIVWIDPQEGPVTGRASQKILRRGARQMTST